ncbi:MAG: hypothetical protein JNL18_14415 [Planctomycetaceae bacterium]|nr:hypothetical protein [Planctomycetaceae bacterium]
MQDIHPRIAVDAKLNGIYKNSVVRFPGPVDIPEDGKVTVTVIDASPPQSPLSSNSPELHALLG